MERLTGTDLDVLRKIYAYTKAHGSPPQNKHIVDMLDTYKSSISECVKKLVACGAVTREHRSLILEEKGMELLREDLSERLYRVKDILTDYGIKKFDVGGKITVSEEMYQTFKLDSREDGYLYMIDIPKSKKPTKDKKNTQKNSIRDKKITKKDTQKSKLRRLLGW